MTVPLGEWRCEDHPWEEAHHGECGAAGMFWFYPHKHEYDKRGLCRVCRMTGDEVLQYGAVRETVLRPSEEP